MQRKSLEFDCQLTAHYVKRYMAAPCGWSLQGCRTRHECGLLAPACPQCKLTISRGMAAIALLATAAVDWHTTCSSVSPSLPMRCYLSHSIALATHSLRKRLLHNAAEGTWLRTQGDDQEDEQGWLAPLCDTRPITVSLERCSSSVMLYE